MLRQRLIVIAVVLLALGFYFASRSSTAPTPLGSPAAPPSTSGEPVKAVTLLKRSRHFREQLAERSAHAMADIPAACVDYFDQLQSLDLLNAEAGSTQLSYQLLPQRPEACQWSDPLLNRMQVEYQRECREAATRNHLNLSSPISEDCVAKLFFMRAVITRLLLKETPIDQITDIHQLVDLLFAEFIGGADGSAPDFRRVHQASDRMLEINPQLYVAAKTAAFTSAIDGIVDAQKGGDRSDEDRAMYWKRAAADLARAEKLRPDDPSLEAVRTAIATEGYNPDKTLLYAEERIQRRENVAENLFWRAYAEWKKDQRSQSIASLQQAIAADPQNAEFRQTLARIQQPNANRDSFTMNFRFGVSSSDFTQ